MVCGEVVLDRPTTPVRSDSLKVQTFRSQVDSESPMKTLEELEKDTGRDE